MARVYEKLSADNYLYGESRITVPDARFYVLYNGEKKQPEERIMKSSDLYVEGGEFGGDQYAVYRI